MFELRKTTTKQQLLDYLIEEAHGAGQLNIVLFSLPAFLDSALAVNIFLNQLKGYPRSIKWYTRDPHIFDILATSKLPLEAIHFDPPQVSTEKKEYKYPDVVEVIEQTLLAGSHTTHNTARIQFNSQAVNAAAMIKVPDVQEQTATTNTNSLLQKPYEKPVCTKLQRTSSAPLDEQNATFQPLVVMHRGEVMNLPQPSTHHIEQEVEGGVGLDEWLANIEKAKESINKVKKQSFFGTDPATKLRSAFETDARKHIRRSKSFVWVGRVALVGGAAAIIAALFFGFGGTVFTPDVYTVTIKQERKEQPVTLALSPDDAKSVVFDSRTESTLSTTGRSQGGGAARGAIGLVNESNQSIVLNNAGFYLQKGSVTYKVESNSSLPAVLSVPGGTSGSAFSFQVVANIDGAGTGLGVGERLSVRNLAGSLISDKLYASVLNEIKLPKAGNYVTQADIDALKKQNRDKNAQKVAEKIQTLEDAQITLPNMTESSVIKEDMNAKLDEVADSLSMISDYKNTITYFEQNTLETSLKTQLKTDRIDALKVNTAEKTTSGYSVNVLAIYYLPQEFDTTEVSNLLQNVSDIKIAETMLKTKYPTIQSVDQKKGFTLMRQEPVIKIVTQ